MKTLSSILVDFLEDSHAHAGLVDVLGNVPAKMRNAPIEGLPYTLWQLLEHIRLAQRDILDYMTDSDYVAGEFPDDYWPGQEAKMDWNRSVRNYQRDLRKIKQLVSQVDPLEELPFGEKGHTFLREVLILGAHLSYHTGQMVAILKMKGFW